MPHDTPLIATVVAGLGLAFVFGTIAQRFRVPPLVGYLLAGIGPFAVGLLHELTGGWTVVLLLLMTTGVGITLAGLRVARPVLVDDEIGVSSPTP